MKTLKLWQGHPTLQLPHQLTKNPPQDTVQDTKHILGAKSCRNSHAFANQVITLKIAYNGSSLDIVPYRYRFLQANSIVNMKKLSQNPKFWLKQAFLSDKIANTPISEPDFSVITSQYRHNIILSLQCISRAFRKCITSYKNRSHF